MKDIFRIPVMLFLLLVTTSVVYPQESTPEPEPGVLRNPLNAHSGADPWLTYYDGSYLGQKFGVIALVAISDSSTERDREAATFFEER